MNIVFINPSLRPDSKRRQLPVGLAYIMTAVKKAGFEFDLIDMDIDQLTMEDIEGLLGQKTYDVCAVGCMVTGYRYVKEIAKIAKKTNPGCLVIAGNSVATSIPELLLRNTSVDVAVLGEADISIVEVLRAVADHTSLSGIQGLAFMDGDTIITTPERPVIKDLDYIGFPDWSIFNLSEYDRYGHVNANVFSSGQALCYPLNSARGCPFKCTFCYHVFKGKRYRKYSEPAIIQEIKRLHSEYHCNFISFWDELTFPHAKSVRTLVEGLDGLDFKVGWEAPTRGNLFKKEHVPLIRDMRNVGCDSLSFSLENASPEILAAMNKKMNVDQFIEQSLALWEGGVTPLTSVVFGYPQETPDTIKRTLKVCEECNIYPSVGFLLPLPGTPIYDWAKNNGHIVDEVEYLERTGDRQDFHINLTAMSDQEFVETVTEGLTELAKKQGLELESVFKTVTYQTPKTGRPSKP